MSPTHDDITAAAVACAVLTISDTRTPDTDESGALIRQLLEKAGHEVSAYAVLRDDPMQVRLRVAELCSACQCILLTGGTGVAARDNTYEAIVDLLDKRLDGFGELFRMLSFQEIGAKAMLSRAIAGTRGATLIFSMPGSTAAVRLAMEKLILPTLSHSVALLQGPKPDHHPQVAP